MSDGKLCFLSHLLRGIVYWYSYDVLNELSTFSKVPPDKCILSTRCSSFSSAVMDAIFSQGCEFYLSK